MEQLRVLMLVSNLRVANGVTSFVVNYYRHLDHSKISVDFALYSDRESPYYDELKQNGSHIFILPSVKNLGYHIEACRKILLDRKYDVIHDNTLHISIPMMWCAKQLSVPVRVLHSHSTKLGETKQKEIRNKVFLPFLRGLATDFTACSEQAGKSMFGKKGFKVIPNVIATDNYCFRKESRAGIRKYMDVEAKFVIGTVGRLAEQKNPLFAIDVFKKLHECIPNTEYWWIGSGNLDNQVRSYIESSGLSGCVRLLGNRNDVLDLYQAMDCFFLPSLFEGLPVTGVEAQAMGLPMVVSDTVTKEMVYTDLVDYVSLREPVDVWVEHIMKAVNRKINRADYSNLLRNSVFSDKGCGDTLTRLYEKMLRSETKM